MKGKKLLVSTLLFISPLCFANESADDGNQHQIDYGIIDLASLAGWDMDTSIIPVVGLTYQYYFEPLSSKDYPLAIQADVNRIARIDIDLNFITEFSPNIGGHFYFDDKWSLEADFIYDRDVFKTSTSTIKDDELYTDIVLNYQLSDKLQLGVGLRNFTENRAYRDELDNFSDITYSTRDSDSASVLQARYTDVINNQGWDHKASISNSSDFNSVKLSSTLFTSRYNGLTFGFVYVDEKDSENSYDDDVISFSFSQHYWFSENTAIKYGISFNRIDDDQFTIADISGTWRF